MGEEWSPPALPLSMGQVRQEGKGSKFLGGGTPPLPPKAGRRGRCVQGSEDRSKMQMNARCLRGENTDDACRGVRDEDEDREAFSLGQLTLSEKEGVLRPCHAAWWEGYTQA